ARADGTVRVLRSNQVGFSGFQISTTQRISPSGSRRQIVIPRPFIVTGMPSGPSIATSSRPSMYARLPSGENVTSVEVHVIRNPGISQLDSTYSRNAGLPVIAGSPGGKTIASSVQYDRMRSMSRPFEETAAHSASRRSSSVLADVKSNLDFAWERDDGVMTERITGDRFSVCPSKVSRDPGDNRLSDRHQVESEPLMWLSTACGHAGRFGWLQQADRPVSPQRCEDRPFHGKKM